MPEMGNEVLSGSEVEPRPMTPELRSIRQQVDEAAARSRAIQRSCSGEDPHLGLATTEEIIEELHARMVVSRANGEPLDLHYRTVDDDPKPEKLEEKAAGLLTQANRLRMGDADPSREAQR